MNTITAPGIYPDFPTADYFGDPCETPSLTQSVAKILIDQSPLHAWHAHPRMNPDYVRDDPTKYDVGNIAHKLMLGRGKDVVVIPDVEDWRTKASKEAREAAAAQGQLAVLGKHAAKAARMVATAKEQLTLRGLGGLFTSEFGQSEVVTAWREGDLWLRQMIDWLHNDRTVFADYKTTAMSVAPHGIGRMMASAGWPIQAAMAERGLDVLDPDNAGRRKYLFVVQEDERPYAITVVQITEGPLTIGRKMLNHGVGLWRECMRNDCWPGYPTTIATPDYPGWAESAWLEREIESSEAAPQWSDHSKFKEVQDRIRGSRGMLTDLAGG